MERMDNFDLIINFMRRKWLAAAQSEHDTYREVQKQGPYLPLTFSACRWGCENSCPGWRLFLSAGGGGRKTGFNFHSDPTTQRNSKESKNVLWWHNRLPTTIDRLIIQLKDRHWKKGSFLSKITGNWQWTLYILYQQHDGLLGTCCTYTHIHYHKQVIAEKVF